MDNKAVRFLRYYLRLAYAAWTTATFILIAWSVFWLFFFGKIFGVIDTTDILTRLKLISLPIVIAIFPIYFFVSLKKITWLKRQKIFIHLIIFILYFGFIFWSLISLPFNPDFYIEGVDRVSILLWAVAIFGLFLPHLLYLILLKKER